MYGLYVACIAIALRTLGPLTIFPSFALFYSMFEEARSLLSLLDSGRHIITVRIQLCLRLGSGILMLSDHL